jgi:hypothetical protein
MSKQMKRKFKKILEVLNKYQQEYVQVKKEVSCWSVATLRLT